MKFTYKRSQSSFSLSNLKQTSREDAPDAVKYAQLFFPVAKKSFGNGPTDSISSIDLVVFSLSYSREAAYAIPFAEPEGHLLCTIRFASMSD